MAKLMYDSANQYSNEKIGQLTDRKVHARHLMTKNDWNEQAEHRWFTVSSLLNKSAHHYLIPMSSSVLTTTCKICSCDPSGVSVIIWLKVCSNVLLRRTTDPNIARTPNTIPALNLKQQHAKHIFWEIKRRLFVDIWVCVGGGGWLPIMPYSHHKQLKNFLLTKALSPQKIK